MSEVKSEISNSNKPSFDAEDGRRKILKKYDKGVKQKTIKKNDSISKNISVVNKYGFLVDAEKAVKMDKDSAIKEVEKQTNWLKILKKWESYYPSTKIKKKLFEGLPDSIRGEVWCRILDVNRDMSLNEGLYENMKYIARETSPDIRQIDLDVNRTFRDHSMFKERYGLKQKSLFHVLAAYTVYNKEVGYCQGMSSVAALLLMYMNEENAFWALSKLLTGKRHSMHGFFVEGFPKLMRFQLHHDQILKKMLGKLYNHFENEGCHSSLYTLKWYMQCFLDRLPFKFIIRMWDIFILEGDKILHPIGYTILKTHRNELIKYNLDQLANFLSNGVCNVTYEPDFFMSQLMNNIDILKKNGLYPVPSVVQGELPTHVTMIGSIEQRDVTKSQVAMQFISLENRNNDKSGSYIFSNSHSPSTNNETIKYSIPAFTGNENTQQLQRILPVAIPLPPNYEAPLPPIMGIEESDNSESIGDNTSPNPRAGRSFTNLKMPLRTVMTPFNIGNIRNQQTPERSKKTNTFTPGQFEQPLFPKKLNRSQFNVSSFRKKPLKPKVDESSPLNNGGEKESSEIKALDKSSKS